MISEKKLAQKIKSLKEQLKKPEPVPQSKVNPTRLLIDLFSGLIVGAFLGYTVDVFLGTLPFLLFIFVILGTLGGFYNSYKVILKNKERDNA